MNVITILSYESVYIYYTINPLFLHYKKIQYNEYRQGVKELLNKLII